jgi:hypothetical protein
MMDKITSKDLKIISVSKVIAEAFLPVVPVELLRKYDFKGDSSDSPCSFSSSSILATINSPVSSVKLSFMNKQ